MKSVKIFTHSIFKNIVLFLGIVSVSISYSWGISVDISTTDGSIRIKNGSIFPESMWVNESNGKFLVGSFRDGKIYEVDEDGSSRVLVKDERLSSVLGITIDQKRRRIYVANSDIGVSVRSPNMTSKKLAALGVYDLDSGRAIDYVDLGSLLPSMNHLANGVAIDNQGNAYVTDSFSPVIYKVDLNGKASVFAQSDKFKGKGINLNGIAYHPGGFLLVIKKSDGALFKVSLKDPSDIKRVNIERSMIGGDGVLLIDSDSMLVVANSASGVKSNSVFSLKTSNNWDSAKIINVRQLDDVYPTTAAIRGDAIYVVHSHLNKLIGSSSEGRDQINHRGNILKIGKVSN